MKLALLAVAMLATAAAAQAPTDAETQFGLAVGNVWEYARAEGTPWGGDYRVAGHERWEIVGLDDAGGERRFTIVGGRLPEPERACDLVATTNAGNYDFLLSVTGPCSFGDLAIRDVPGVDRSYVARVGIPGCYDLGDPWQTPTGTGPLCGSGGESGQDQGSLGSVYSVRVTTASETLSGVGIRHAYVMRDSTNHVDRTQVYVMDSRYLTYARLDGVEYGEPRVVAADPGPDRPAAALRLYPNPTAGALTAAAEGPGTLVVVDALGREVARREGSPPGPVRLDLSDQPSGEYLVRWVGADGQQATARASVVR
ncbi:T9SS type A sorting domain-containing protein [Rubrivirga sp. IMCC43871]|uniref:T9SS type A sorting domain-containing protein n=1 Tax=Rubrivirga sp. IMCC43871 TaxID=3391575 RepID=UPI00398FCE40